MEDVSEACVPAAHRFLWSPASTQGKPEHCCYTVQFDLSESHTGDADAFWKKPFALDRLQRTRRTLHLGPRAGMKTSS